VVVGSYPLSSQAPTHVEVELGCDNIKTVIKTPCYYLAVSNSNVTK
jgi:hypothetical protein